MEQSSQYMSAGSCDSQYKNAGDGKCVETCNQGEAVNAQTGMCESCGGNAELICPTGMPQTLNLRAGCGCANIRHLSGAYEHLIEHSSGHMRAAPECDDGFQPDGEGKCEAETI